MFVACPHCGYLVALVVASDAAARTCPRCNGALQSEVAGGGEVAATPAGTDAAAAADTAAQRQHEPTPAPAATAAASAQPAASAAIDDIASTLRKRPSATPGAVPSEPTGADSSRAVEPADPAAQADPTGDIAAARPANAGDAATGDAAAEPVATPDAAANPADAPLPPLTATVPVARKRAAARAGKSETAVSSVRRAPSFARQHARATAAAPRLHWSGPLLIALLAVVLVLQLLLAQRDELAADARWRPLLGGLCGALGCDIPAWREPSALTMLNRNVLPVADRAGVLRVDAGFRNDARWAQPWPVLVLSLEDVDGRRVGQRAFAPKDYRKGHKAGELIAPGQSAAVQFEVLEPAPRVVAFTFDFR